MPLSPARMGNFPLLVPHFLAAWMPAVAMNGHPDFGPAQYGCDMRVPARRGTPNQIPKMLFINHKNLTLHGLSKFHPPRPDP